MIFIKWSHDSFEDNSCVIIIITFFLALQRYVFLIFLFSLMFHLRGRLFSFFCMFFFPNQIMQ